MTAHSIKIENKPIISGKIFSKIFYINLDRRSDRDENVKKLLKQHDLDKITERISAVDGSKLNLDTIPETLVTKKGILNAKNKKMRVGVPMTPGAIGCAFSHKKVWEKIVNENIDAALILEDDIRMSKHFNKLIKKYSRYLPGSYDVLFFGYHPSSIKYVNQITPGIFVRTQKIFGLFGYVVTKKGAEKLLKLFPIEDQIDTEIYRGFTTRNINAYVIRPELRFITSDPSEVAKEFGTDIQIREKFGDQNSSTIDDLFAVILILIILVLYVLLVDQITKI